MLQLNGKTLQYGRAFTHNGKQYPANWLRLTTLEEKQAIGIVEFPSSNQSWDSRFYLNADTPKDLDELKTYWKRLQNETSATLLAPSDWRVVRAAELGQTVASNWLTYRGAVRSACNTRQSEINSVTTVDALKELFFGPAQVQQTDSDGNPVVGSDNLPVMIDNPNLATKWPTSP